MMRHVMLLAVFAVLGSFSAGCGPATDDPAPETGAPTTEQLPSEEATPDDGEVTQMARNCQTTCSGVKATGESCSVIGFGSTTFLGGCTKACRFARADADANASSSGCILSTCSDVCR
ncbi:hypothetical protein [Pyxidicoccus xibeiensis]|uniref:hypothetical protein n=1 Tax=Pyxidicoccus xibeiensis TaxID=2906759 RepID=UPI0020A7A734|nr:hypothetical protein [Pyxidicoccus xibeiensis]MCP3144312.1 hypothetical protein [Pyxidicoccus xibeiensis]